MTSPFLKAATGCQKKPEMSVFAATTDASKSVFAPSVLDASPVYAPAAPQEVPVLPSMTRQEIEEIGAEAGTTLRSLNAEVLKHQRSNQGDQMSERLTALIKQAKQLDPNSIKQSKGITKLIKKVMGMKEDLFGEFDNVNNRIEELVKNLQMDIRKEEDSLVYLEKLHQAIGQYAASLNRDMQLLTATYEKEEQALAALPEDAVEQRQVIRDTLDLLEIRIADLKALRLLCVQMGPRVQGMQKVSASLMRSARNIVNNVIPAYSANFSMYIESLRQMKAAESQNNVLDEFNLAIKLGSDLATQNQIEAAALANRQVLDIETLRHDQENLVKMLEETNRINTEARAARVDYINEVQSLEDGMVAAVKRGLGK
ncbi:hypothetical protein [Escherichia phage AV125]|nr:hypothetical protein [Escherichia phage AV125]